MTRKHQVSDAFSALANAMLHCRYTPPAAIQAVPISLRSTAHLGQHWAQAAKRAKLERTLGESIGVTLRRQCPRPWAIMLTRHYSGRSRAYDRDNLERAMKSFRDGLAFAFFSQSGASRKRAGQYDSDSRVSWLVDQQRDTCDELVVAVWAKQETPTRRMRDA